MNILYISFLNGDSWAGPTYSIPKQIAAQAKYDNVFWYNIRETKVKEWKKEAYYHDLDDYPSGLIKALPVPFNKPDIIVIEQFYGFAGNKILREIKRSDIPYVIIPRGELTASAQKRKAWKKIIANAVIFERFSKKAAAIEYLTEQEKKDSGNKWNANCIVVPNGIDVPDIKKQNYNINGIRCIGVGRIEPYHKGLDMLIEACGMIKQELLEASCKVDLFGPDYDGRVTALNELITKFGIEKIVSIHDGLYDEAKRIELLNSDIFLITSRFEGHPMSLIEALSFGLPCIATRGSNMKEEIEKYDAGWTAETNTESIKHALLLMIEEKRKIPEKGINAIALSKEYGWERIARLTHDHYMALITRPT